MGRGKLFKTVRLMANFYLASLENSHLDHSDVYQQVLTSAPDVPTMDNR